MSLPNGFWELDPRYHRPSSGSSVFLRIRPREIAPGLSYSAGRAAYLSERPARILYVGPVPLYAVETALELTRRRLGGSVRSTWGTGYDRRVNWDLPYEIVPIEQGTVARWPTRTLGWYWANETRHPTRYRVANTSRGWRLRETAALDEVGDWTEPEPRNPWTPLFTAGLVSMGALFALRWMR